MNSELLGLFAKYMEKQEVLSKLTEAEQLHGYNYSEIHTIAAIGDLESPNVTAIARTMHMTRGAISKIAKRLASDGLIEPYMAEGNNQKVFFRLTAEGRALYDEHERRHSLWLERDDAFLRRYSDADLARLQQFMEDFNAYLEERIKELGGSDDADRHHA